MFYPPYTKLVRSGKDKLYPENYRGITVTNTVSTLTEGILKELIEPNLLKTQSKLQRGFTKNTSYVNAAFIVSEAGEHYKEILQELVLVTLDAKNAFDKIHHEILFNKFYHDGITENTWLLLKKHVPKRDSESQIDSNLYDGSVQELGVRQGVKLSTVLYKRYSNTIHRVLEKSELGASIGNINVAAPTCADDIAILAGTEHKAQALLNIVHSLTAQDLVTLNPIKSDIVPLTKTDQEFNIYFGDDKKR